MSAILIEDSLPSIDSPSFTHPLTHALTHLLTHSPYNSLTDLIEGATGVPEAATAHHGHAQTEGGEQGRQNEAHLVPHPTRAVLVHEPDTTAAAASAAAAAGRRL